MTKISGSAGNLTYRILEGKQVMGFYKELKKKKTPNQLSQKYKNPLKSPPHRWDALHI